MPRSFRLVCRPEHIELVEDLLRAEGHVFTPEPFHPLARRMLEEPTPLGGSTAAAFGLIYIQDRSSMLAPILLHPPQGGKVLDMCASPGSKTGLLAQLVGPTGMVLANEPNPRRLATLRQNMTALNLAQVVTCGLPAQEIPLPEAAFSHVQLDPPCSGWGTVERNPRVRNMWPERKLGPLIALQRVLLRKASKLLAPGGRLLYSTCTTNPAENRAQIRWAVGELGLIPAELLSVPGFDHSRIDTEQDNGCLQIQTEAGEGQGFFFAALTQSRSSSPTKDVDLGQRSVSDQHWNQETRARKRAVRFGARAMLDGKFPGKRVQPESFRGGENVAWGQLPPGQLREFSGRLVFLAEPALSLPGALSWRGFELGRVAGGAVRLDPRLRLLLPEYVPGRGLNVDDVDVLKRLLQGQSLVMPLGRMTGKSGRGDGRAEGRIGLYWRGMPLGWATLKNGRCLWSST